MTEHPQSPDPATQSQEAAAGEPARAERVAPDAVASGAVPPDHVAPEAVAAEPAWPAPAWPPTQTDGAEGSGEGPAAIVAERPEIAVGAAFAGGFVLAMLLKRLAR